MRCLPDAFSRSQLHDCEQQRLFQDCAYAQVRLSLCWSPCDKSQVLMCWLKYAWQINWMTCSDQYFEDIFQEPSTLFRHSELIWFACLFFFFRWCSLTEWTFCADLVLAESIYFSPPVVVGSTIDYSKALFWCCLILKGLVGSLCMLILVWVLLSCFTCLHCSHLQLLITLFSVSFCLCLVYFVCIMGNVWTWGEYLMPVKIILTQPSIPVVFSSDCIKVVGPWIFYGCSLRFVSLVLFSLI